MKINLTITKALIALVGLTLTSCSTWHYHNPRVSVDREKVNTITPIHNAPVEISAITEPVAMNKKGTQTQQANYTQPNKTTTVKLNGTKNTPLTNIQKTESKSPIQLFVEHLKKQDKKPCKIQKAEKEAATGWIRIMIIFFVVGFILLLVGIFLSIFLFGPFWWIFYAFGGLLILAGFIILILVLIGLI